MIEGVINNQKTSKKIDFINKTLDYYGSLLYNNKCDEHIVKLTKTS